MIICVTRKRELLREAEWLVQSLVAEPMEAERGSRWAQSRLVQTAGQGCLARKKGQHAVSETLKISSSKPSSIFFLKLLFPQCNMGPNAVSLSTQFDLATKFKVFLVIISAFFGS